MTGPQGKGSAASVERLCALAGVSRASFYREWASTAPGREEIELRDAIQRAVLGYKHYGYRRVTAALRRQGWAVNHKRVLRIMREDNLLCLTRAAFKPATTVSNHAWRIWPNLARRVVPMAANRLWVADITYVRLAEEFVYLAVILDAFSRKVIGWAMEDHLRASLAIAALEMALAERDVKPGELIHHSDRGVQYACGDYIDRLEQAGIQPSMSRAGCPGACPRAGEARPVGQRHGRELHENAEGRRGRCCPIPRPRRCQKRHRQLHRPCLQSTKTALGLELSAARGVRIDPPAHGQTAV